MSVRGLWSNHVRKTESDRVWMWHRKGEEGERGRGGGADAALLHFLIELLSGLVNLHSLSACRLLPCQINIDSLNPAFLSIQSQNRETKLDQRSGSRAAFRLKNKKRKNLNIQLFFWRVFDQSQKHFHYSQLYLQFIIQPWFSHLTNLRKSWIQNVLFLHSTSFPSSG